ncbi:hypothetical protein NMY22_g17962 [Coprinellus aureogranulatus]|nr:hypothetical protein NMY22_g17962 [Coprinellus aureogranulatus]
MDQISRCLVQEGISFRPNVTRPGEYDSASGKNQKTRDAEGADKEGLHYDQYRFPVVLVLEVRLSGKVGYYFAHHPMRRLFWLEDFNISYNMGGVGVDRTNPHVGWEMRSQYWAHNEFFSDFYKLTEGDLVEIDNMLSFALGDQIISEMNSNNFTAFTPDQLRFMQQMLREFKEKPADTRQRSVGDTTILWANGTHVSREDHERFRNLSGERGARLDTRRPSHYSMKSYAFLYAIPLFGATCLFLAFFVAFGDL